MEQGTADTTSHRPNRRRVWTVDAVIALGTVTDIETAGSILGIGRTKAYELARAREFPVEVVRIGKQYVVPVPAILRILGIQPTAKA